MSDYLNPDQIRDLYAETIARARFERWGYADEHWNGMRGDLVREALQDVDALATAGLLPIVTVRYQTDGKESIAYRTPLRFTSAQRDAIDAELAAGPLRRVIGMDVPPPPPAPGKGRGPR